MKQLLCLLIAFASLGLASAAEEAPAWLINTKTAESDTRRTVRGFGASVLICSDADWQAKWDKRDDHTPEFTPTDTLKVGDTATILIFYSNPKIAEGGNADVTCDIRIIRPNNKVSDHRGLKGFRGKIKGAITNTFLVETTMSMSADPTDPVGLWNIEITVHDNVRDAEVPLKTSFTLVK